MNMYAVSVRRRCSRDERSRVSSAAKRLRDLGPATACGRAMVLSDKPYFRSGVICFAACVRIALVEPFLLRIFWIAGSKTLAFTSVNFFTPAR
jgi:hypothetical protein